MSWELKFYSILFLLLLLFFIIYLLMKNQISVKYSFVWTLPCIILIFFILVPGFLKFFTELLGFQTSSNMILTLIIAFLLFVSISLTVIVSSQNEKIRLLIQEVSMLKEKK